MNSIARLHQLNQSLWYDNIERKLLKNGEMARMIQAGEIRGVTSNPSIFQNAIANSTDYDDALQSMSWADGNSEDMFFQLAIEDIQDTADLFLPLYKQSGGTDGFVSLEVSPKLAYDSQGTIEQAHKLWKAVNRPNLMIKIPATREGLAAIRQTIAAGLNINVTLIFSVERYAEVMEAYLRGLEDRVERGMEITDINSVASFFVSRVDSKIDIALEKMAKDGKIRQADLQELQGKAAVANSKVAYSLYESFFSSDRARKLLSQGGRAQRPLWASTSTKNPNYSDVLYVEELIGDNTVNTVPPKTLEAFRDHGNARLTIREGLDQAHEFLQELQNHGIHLNEVTQQLEDEGVVSFATAFSGLLATIEERKKDFQNQLGVLRKPVARKILKLDQNQTVSRLFSKDASLWTEDPKDQLEVTHRLGWLQAPYSASGQINNLKIFRDEVLRQGFTHALLIGMGGSSLAPEVLALTFDREVKGLSLSILDSTDPRQVLLEDQKTKQEKTLFIIASKSGSTSEVQANLAYFYEKQKEIYGELAGQNFVAITDPGTSLAKQAQDMGFFRLFESDPNVGGRYSALTLFGLVPAALIGVELDKFIGKAINFADDCQPNIPAGRNPGLVLGAVLAEAYRIGKNKLTIIAEDPFLSFGSWLEQLIAESSGKTGKGIIPLDTEPLIEASQYGEDRLFVYLRNRGEQQEFIEKLIGQHHPVVRLDLYTPYQLGEEFYRWEIAIAVACSEIGVNAFNQPDVQDSKVRTQQKIVQFRKKGNFSLPAQISNTLEATVSATFDMNVPSSKPLKVIMDNALATVSEGWAVAINAFLPRTEHNTNLLEQMRRYIMEQTGCATTLGFGPRFLHSTGQLQKGGPAEILVLMISDEIPVQVEIPGWGLGYENLILAQALGDYESLLSQSKLAIWFQLKDAGIQALYKAAIKI